MKDKLIKAALSFAVVCVLGACTKNYLDINSNPYEVDKEQMEAKDYAIASGLSAMFGTVGFKLYSIDLGLAAPIKAVRTIPDLQQKTFVLLQFDDDTISACLFVQGQYTYSTRSRLFNPRGSAESGTEIAQKLSGLIQFHTTSKSEHRI